MFMYVPVTHCLDASYKYSTITLEVTRIQVLGRPNMDTLMQKPANRQVKNHMRDSFINEMCLRQRWITIWA